MDGRKTGDQKTFSSGELKTQLNGHVSQEHLHTCHK